MRSNEPGGESTFRLGFDLNINEVSLGSRPLEILRVAGSKDTNHLRLTLEKDAGHYWLSLRVRRADSSFRHVGRTRVPPKRTVRIEIDWLRASAKDSADGEARVFKNGELRIAATDLRNGGRNVRSVTLGLPAGSNGADSGSFLIDSYTSTP